MVRNAKRGSLRRDRIAQFAPADMRPTPFEFGGQQRQRIDQRVEPLLRHRAADA